MIPTLVHGKQQTRFCLPGKTARGQQPLCEVKIYVYAYLRRKGYIDRVVGEINDWTMSPNIKNCIIVLYTDFSKLLCASELCFDGLVLEEHLASFVIGKCLY